MPGDARLAEKAQAPAKGLTESQGSLGTTHKGNLSPSRRPPISQSNLSTR